MSDYRPIDCGLYSRYEVAIMHRDWLKLSWRDAEGMNHLEVLRPVDLETRDGAEYLIAHNRNGDRFRLRLDRIDRVDPVAGGD